MLGADEALRIGLVNAVVPHAELDVLQGLHRRCRLPDARALRSAALRFLELGLDAALNRVREPAGVRYVCAD